MPDGNVILQCKTTMPDDNARGQCQKTIADDNASWQCQLTTKMTTICRQMTTLAFGLSSWNRAKFAPTPRQISVLSYVASSSQSGLWLRLTSTRHVRQSYSQCTRYILTRFCRPLVFFHKSTTHRPLKNTLKYFRILFRIRGASRL
jgi:hypothetical protein